MNFSQDLNVYTELGRSKAGYNKLLLDMTIKRQRKWVELMTMQT